MGSRDIQASESASDLMYVAPQSQVQRLIQPLCRDDQGCGGDVQ